VCRLFRALARLTRGRPNPPRRRSARHSGVKVFHHLPALTNRRPRFTPQGVNLIARQAGRAGGREVPFLLGVPVHERRANRRRPHRSCSPTRMMGGTSARSRAGCRNQHRQSSLWLMSAGLPSMVFAPLPPRCLCLIAPDLNVERHRSPTPPGFRGVLASRRLWVSYKVLAASLRVLLAFCWSMSAARSNRTCPDRPAPDRVEALIAQSPSSTGSRRFRGCSAQELPGCPG